jgi:hypothetical protein
LTSKAQQPSWIWAKEVNNYNSFGPPLTMVTSDQTGNVYLTGSLGTYSYIEIMFLTKLNANGDTIWKRTALNLYDTSSMFYTTSQGYSVKTDGVGNVYVAGNFGDKVVFGNDTLTSAGIWDIFLVKYNQYGDVVWAKSAGGIYNDQMSWDGMCIRDGNIFITGYYGLQNPSSATPTLQFDTITVTSRGGTDNFIASYDTAGNVRWAKTIGGLKDDATDYTINMVNMDAAQNVYLAGDFAGAAYFGNVQVALDSGYYLLKCDINGNLSWAKTITGEVFIGPFISTDPAGNSYITGTAIGQMNFGNQTFANYNFLAKYDPNGVLLWVKDLNNSLNFATITADLSGVYLLNSFSIYCVISGDTLTSEGGSDMVVSNFDLNGTKRWTIQAGGHANDYSYNMCLSSGDLLVCGAHEDTINFGNAQLSGKGVFVSKLQLPTGVINIGTKAKSVSVYPNPNTGSFTIDSQSQAYQSLSIVDITGKQVYQQSINPARQQEINLNLPDGVYFIRLTGKGEAVVQKFIVQH